MIEKLQTLFPKHYRKGNILLINADCMDVMQHIDEKFDLAIVDPPYGLNMAKERPRKAGRFAGNVPKKWDEKIPNKLYFKELFIASKNQIIWGSNYFPLPEHQCFIFWYKQNPVDNFSDGELAWTSFNRPSKCFNFKYYGSLQGCLKADKKIHISQKPIELYDWLLTNYAKPGQTILDTHLGSGSSAIAAHYFGCTFVGIELDEDYFLASVERFKQATAQQDLMEFA
jgi:site-specific DNA-methyltransferase (adenine-specific)